MSDLISRQAAIDALKNRWKKTRNYEGIGDDIAEECELYLKQVPSAQSEPKSYRMGYQAGYAAAQRWIPCSTALPDDDTEVIVSCTDDSWDSEISYVTTGWYYKGLWIVNNDICYFVKAWQPLPAKPYLEGGQDG